MGTASFGVPVLDNLLKSGFDIVAVVTAPDKPAGRGKKIRFSPVKEYALEHNLVLLQPEKLKDPLFVRSVIDLKPDIQVVVAFRMLPRDIWMIPALGTLNLHASLLPQLRGAAPINHAIINGLRTTGLTTFLIDEEIDTGRVLKQEEVNIGEEETAGELHDRMMAVGAGLVLETVRELLEGKAIPVDQKKLAGGSGPLLPAPKIFKDDCRIDWNGKTGRVYDFIRGLSPVPGAFTTLRLKDGSTRTLKVFRTLKSEKNGLKTPGSVRYGKNTLEVACADGFLSLTEVQLEGKRKMEIEEFIRGFNPENIIEAG